MGEGFFMIYTAEKVNDLVTITTLFLYLCNFIITIIMFMYQEIYLKLIKMLLEKKLKSFLIFSISAESFIKEIN